MEYPYIDITTPQGSLPIPILPVVILRRGGRRGEKCFAEVDTGFDKSLLLDYETYSRLELSPSFAIDIRELSGVGAVLDCLVFEVEIVVENRWFDVEAYFPTKIRSEGGQPYRYTGNPVIGMKLLNELDVELNGVQKRISLK